MGGTKTEVVKRAILEAKERLDGEAFTPNVGAAFVMPSPPPAAAVEYPFHPKCDHCGETFGAWNRWARLCSECKRGGHGGETRECSVCGLAGTGAI